MSQEILSDTKSTHSLDITMDDGRIESVQVTNTSCSSLCLNKEPPFDKGCWYRVRQVRQVTRWRRSQFPLPVDSMYARTFPLCMKVETSHNLWSFSMTPMKGAIFSCFK